MKWTPAKANNIIYDSAMALYKLDCASQQYGAVYGAYYTKSRNVGDSHGNINGDAYAGMEPTFPGSIGEAMLQSICRRH